MLDAEELRLPQLILPFLSVVIIILLKIIPIVWFLFYAKRIIITFFQNLIKGRKSAKSTHLIKKP
jgi:hypothetical protein